MLAGVAGNGGALKSVARPPDPPAMAPRWLRLDCRKGASRLRLELRAQDLGAPKTSVNIKSREDLFYVSVHTRLFLLPFLFLLFRPATAT